MSNIDILKDIAVFAFWYIALIIVGTVLILAVAWVLYSLWIYGAELYEEWKWRDK